MTATGGGRRTPLFECVDLCSVDFQSEQPTRLLQIDVIRFYCQRCLGGADLKRFKESPVFEIVPIARAIIDAIKLSLIHFQRGKLGEAPRLSLLKHRIVEIFETQCDAVRGQRLP